MVNKVFIKKIVDILNKERAELLNKAQQKIDIDMDGDETDEVQGTMLMELNNQFNSRNNLKIKQIAEALSKIEDSTYGACDDCGEDIPEKRLLINPHFLTCVTCAEAREIEEKQRKRF